MGRRKVSKDSKWGGGRDCKWEDSVWERGRVWERV